MDDVVFLIAQEMFQDELYMQHSREIRRQIFCQVDSVKRTEFFAAGQSGLSPEFCFIVFPLDYAGETELEFHGKRYVVYRTFQRDADHLEIYVQRKGGVQ